jgi:NADH:ubiquinone reductase (non-electrogenic)
MLRLGVFSAGINAAARRPLMTSSLARAVRPSSPNLLPKSKLRQSFRRGYAELPPVAPAVPAKKPRRFRVLRWIWRATYISLLGGVGYLAYTVYDLRHPVDQIEPDPTKQNLVILGVYPKL